MSEPPALPKSRFPFRIPGVLLAVAVCAVFYVASIGTHKISGAFPHITAEIQGVFPRDGQFPREPLADADNVRVWGSLRETTATGLPRDAMANIGTISIGPFPAPARLRFGVTGHPADPGNQLAIELVSSGERLPVRLPMDIGGRWNIVDVDLPATWTGQPVRLFAGDASRSTWLGVSEPIVGGRGEANHGLRQTLAAWTINGLLLGLMWLAAWDWLGRRGWVESQWLPLLAAGAVAAIGYAGFWIYFGSAIGGKIFSVVVVLLAFAQAWRRRHAGPLGGDLARVAQLMIAVGTFYVALLHLFPSSAEFDSLAANRFRENMPGDNTLPYNLAAALAAGKSPKVPGNDYQSSDRPPLQTGWLLLTWPVTQALGCNDRGAAGTAAVWFQLLWIPAAFGLFRTLRLPPARAAPWTGVMALSGFFLQNTIYTWPKLAAAAFACGAFAIWLMPTTAPRPQARFVLGAALAALAWLSHGGAAFSFLALLPWIAWRVWRDGIRGWLPAAAVVLMFAAPWTLYQNFYEPPGNMLLKEHLAGVDERDPRGTLQTIRESYQASPWSEIIARKQANFALQVEGDWLSLLDFSSAGAPARRADEFYHTVRALSWWPLAIPFLALMILLRRTAKEELLGRRSWHAGLFLWVALTISIWCLLMFRGAHAVIHQGSYAGLLVLFVLCSSGLEHAGRWTLGLIALLQTATLVSTYAVANAHIHGDPTGLGFVVLAGAALAGTILVGLRAESTGGAARP